MDNATLPLDLLDPKQINYFRAHSAVEIATHLAAKLKMDTPSVTSFQQEHGEMRISENRAKKQIFIQSMNGSIDL